MGVNVAAHPHHLFLGSAPPPPPRIKRSDKTVQIYSYLILVKNL